MRKRIIEYLRKRGFNQVNDKMHPYINLWGEWYQGDVKKFHHYKVWNGKKKIPCQLETMNLGKSVCEEWADLLFNEKCLIAINHEDTNDFVKSVFDDNNFWIKINEYQEFKSAYGTVCYIPYAKGVEVTKEGDIVGADGITMNYVTADNFIPLSWQNGVINELATINEFVSEGENYAFVQLFLLEKDGYVTESHLFSSGKAGRKKELTEVELSSVTEYANIAPRFESKSFVKPFIIDRLNIPNNIDKDSPYGISVFANAISSMKFCDVIFDSYKNEFSLGKKRIMAKSEAMQLVDGQPTFDPNDILFYQLPDDLDGEDFIKEINMIIRAGDHELGIQRGLNIFSSRCGLGDNHFRFQQGGVTTATQVVSENSKMFRTLGKHEIILEAVLVDLIKLIISIGKNVLKKQDLDEDAEITITFDDSIIEDKETELKRMREEVAAGLIKPEKYLMKRYGVTEEEARKMMPEMSRVIGQANSGVIK